MTRHGSRARITNAGATRWRRSARGLVTVALVALVTAGCEEDTTFVQASARTAPEPAYGDTFIDTLLGNISGLVPNITSDNASHLVGDLVYNGLVKLDRDKNLVSDLAESWTVSPDCRDLTFKLRQGVKWHDGRPFTASDVLFTHETMTHPKTPSAYKEDFLMIERIEAPDPHTVRVRYKNSYAKAVQSWTMHILPRHLLESAVREGKLREAPQNLSQPVGTGPYRFIEWKSGEKVVLAANRDHFAGRPHLARVVFRIIPSQATQFLELKAQGVDAMLLTSLQYRRQTEYPAFRKAYNKYSFPADVYIYFGLNLKDERFADKRVRHAFAHAINKKELIEHVMLGLAREATGPFKPGTWPFNPNARNYPHDPARARALLAEAGWKERNADGVLLKNGKPFTFEIVTNQGNDERKKVAEIIQAALREIGIGAEIRTIEWAALLKEWIRKRRFDAIVLGWGIGADPDQYNIWHSSKTAPEDFNSISYANPQVDELLEKGRTTCVQADRAKYYQRIHEILAEDQPYIFLYFRDELPAITSRVHGIAPAANGIRYNMMQWFVPKTMQRYTEG